MNSYNFKAFIKDITGPYSLEFRAYLWAIPVFITFSILITVDLKHWYEILWAILANICSLAICAAITLAFGFTAFKDRHKKPVKAYWVLILGVVLGATKGLGTAYFMWLFGVENSLVDAIQQRIVQTTINGTLFVPMVAVVFSTIQRFKLQRDALVSELARSYVAEDAIDKKVAALLNEGERDTALALGKIKDKLADSIATGGENLKSLSATLRQLVAEDVRPLSHKIWNTQNRRLTDFSFRDLSRLAMLNYRFQSLPVVIFFHLTVLPYTIARKGLVHGSLDTLVSIVSMTLIFTIGKRIKVKSLWASITVFIVGIALSGFITSIVHPIFGNGHADEAFLRSDLVNMLWLYEISFVAALVKTALASHEEIEVELKKLVGEREAIHEISLQKHRIKNRELAQYLHGQVQNQMLHSALKLEEQAGVPSDRVAESEIKQIIEMLDEAKAGAFSYKKRESLKNQLEAIEQQWHGIVDIEIDIDDELNAALKDDRTIHEIGQLINEAVTNASRHGMASRIELKLDLAAPGAMKIEIKDDGLGPKLGAPGLGSALYSALAGPNWKLSACPSGGSLLTATIEIN